MEFYSRHDRIFAPKASTCNGYNTSGMQMKSKKMISIKCAKRHFRYNERKVEKQQTHRNVTSKLPQMFSFILLGQNVQLLSLNRLCGPLTTVNCDMYVIQTPHVKGVYRAKPVTVLFEHGRS
ncbi:hypothetical protein Tcan_00757, partial [Toxocara canis]